VPSYAPPYQDLVDLYLMQDRPDAAMALLDTAVAYWPDAGWVHFRMGHLYQGLKQYEQAEHAYQKVLSAEPGRAGVQAMLGNVLYEQEKYEEAVEAYRQAILLNPKDHSSINNLAWVYSIWGENLDDGIRLSRRALRLSPDSPTYLDTLAELYYKKAEYERAAEIIRYAISLQPEDPVLKDHLEQQLQKFLAAGRGKV
ncbi:MAG: tetratricopeptide repeat protein, partial [bacterium]|nr:tetratricopeptide repeat protein [bacterium]